MVSQLASRPLSLLGLPPEIQFEIFSYLTVSIGHSSIFDVLRTCKQLYKVALPLSASVFRNTGHEGPCSPARNAQFLRYILISKPELAQHVKTVVLASFSSDGYEDPDTGDNHPNAESNLTVYKQKIQAILEPMGPDDYESWCREWVADLKRGRTDAQVALILLSCPNIQTLMFEESYQPRFFLRLMRMVRELNTEGMSDVAVPLSKLQDVFQEFHEVYQEDPDEIRRTQSSFHEQAPDFFTFTRLRCYEYIRAGGDNQAATRFGTLSPRASPVEEIILRDSFCSAPTLRNMLLACKALKKFEFTRGPRKMFDEELLPRDVLDAILPHANSLEYLYLDTKYGWGASSNWQDRPKRLFLGTELLRMTVLKKLTVGMQSLTGMFQLSHDDDAGWLSFPPKIEGAPRLVDCLPQNLEYLKIHECGRSILDQLTELLLMIDEGTGFQKLRYICLLFREGTVTEDEIGWFREAPNVDIGFYIEDILYVNEGSWSHKGDRRVHSEYSRIYCPNFRVANLEHRGRTFFKERHDGITPWWEK